MDPDPLRLLETAHPLRSPALLPSSPNSRFRLRPNDRLTHPPETVNKRVKKIVKNVDGPTQMSRARRRSRSLPVRDLRPIVVFAAKSVQDLRGLPWSLQPDDSSSISFG